jgi:nitrogen fixation/metabolism regulation signal transduction histidine kinase
MLGKTERRLALVILLTAVIPLAVGVMLAYSLVNYASSVWLKPEVGEQLERNVGLYADYVKVVKDDMRHQTDALAADETLRQAAKAKDPVRLDAELARLFPLFPELVSLTVMDSDGEVLARRDRGRPVNDALERKLDVPRPLADDGAEDGPRLTATFAFDRRYEKDLERAGTVRDLYANLVRTRETIYEAYFKSFAALLGATMLVTVVLGFLLARGVTKRINRLADAINSVALGDLGVRVPVTGSDEITELSRVFNRMLGEMQQSRARIEYLQRIGAWQEMAQRLAHEIKNPLTPIQLAVQECHRKYEGGDPRFRALLDTTLEVVEEEVGTLRRLVGNFSNFARLPQVELKDEDLRDLLRECSERLTHLEQTAPGTDADDVDGEPLGVHDVTVRWEIPEAPLPASIDRQMLRRVLVNLVRNAMQAIRDSRAAKGGGDSAAGLVVVSARAEDPSGAGGVAILVEDDGPGVSAEARERIFDPYFTTKVDGTGLGLAIVKKVVVEHGGTIEVQRSERLGGASFVLHLPAPHGLGQPAPSDRTGAPPPARPSRRALA